MWRFIFFFPPCFNLKQNHVFYHSWYFPLNKVSSPAGCCPRRRSTTLCRQAKFSLCWCDSRGQKELRRGSPSERPTHWWCSRYNQWTVVGLWFRGSEGNRGMRSSLLQSSWELEWVDFRFRKKEFLLRERLTAQQMMSFVWQVKSRRCDI